MGRLDKLMEKKSMQNYQTPLKHLCLWKSAAQAVDWKSVPEVLYVTAVGYWWRQVTALPSTAFPPLVPMKEPWGLFVKLRWLSCCVQPACTGHYARKYFKSCVVPSGDRFKFSLGSRQTWTDYLWVSYKIQLAFLNWSIACLRKIEWKWWKSLPWLVICDQTKGLRSWNDDVFIQLQCICRHT